MTEAESILTIRWTHCWRAVPLAVSALSLGTVLSLGGCGGDGGQKEAAVDHRSVDYGSGGAFPVPSEIEPNVNFWRNVYGVWGRHQVAFHDDEHMGVIYEVAELPGATQEGYSEAQRAFVHDRTEYYKDQLRDLERRQAANQPLTPQQEVWLAKFEQDGGARGVYGAAERLRMQRGLRDRFRRGLEISGRYDKAFREVMRANGLPEDLAYLPHVESSFQTNAVSSAGATGVWQFMPATGRIFMNVNGAVDDRMDPILSAQGAARYLAQAHNRLGSWPLAVTSYNHGQGGMANAKAQYGQDFGSIVKNYQGKAFKFASRNYYAEFIAAREVAGHPERYFPEGINYASPWPNERLILASSMPADQVARHYGLSAGSLADLNMHWRGAARDGRAQLPAGSTVWLPAGTLSRVPGQPSGYGFAIASRDAARPLSEPMTAAAANMAFQAARAEPVLAELPPRPRTSAAPHAAPARPKLARVEPGAEPWDETPIEPPVEPGAEPRARPRVVRQEPGEAWDEAPVAPRAAPSVQPQSRVARQEPRVEPAQERDVEPVVTPEPRLARAEPRVEPAQEGDVEPVVTPEPRVARQEPKADLTDEQDVRSEPWPESRVARQEPRYEPAEDEDVQPEPRPAPRVAKHKRRVEPAPERYTRPEPQVAQAEPKHVKSAWKAAKSEPKVAKAEPKAEPKAAKPEAPTVKANAKPTKTDTRIAKTDAKADARIAKVDAKTAKADAKTAKADPKVDPKADRAEAKTAKNGKVDAKVAKADAKAAKPDAKTGKPDAKTAKAEKSEAQSGSNKVHVVKAQETLFRVASGNGITVAELRRLNKLGPNDNSVRPGQKLKVGT